MRTPKRFTKAQRAYYYKVILSYYQAAYRAAGYLKSNEEINIMLRSMFLYYEEYNPKTDTQEKVLHTLRDGESLVTYEIMQDFLLQCIRFAAENMDWAIPMMAEEWTEEKMTDWQLQNY